MNNGTNEDKSPNEDKSSHEIWHGILLILILLIVLLSCVGIPFLSKTLSIPFKESIDFATLLFSWPMVIGVIALMAFFRFYSAISYLIKYLTFDIEKKKFGAQKPIQEHPEKIKKPDELKKEMENLLHPSKEIIQNLSDKIKKDLPSTEKEAVLLQFENYQIYQNGATKIVNDAVEAAEYWEFQYCSQIFAPMTKKLLRALSFFDDLNEDQIEKYSKKNIPNFTDLALLESYEVLTNYGMITHNDRNQYRITEKGRKYLKAERTSLMTALSRYAPT